MEISLLDIWQSIKRHFSVIILLIIVFSALSFSLSKFVIPPKYVSSAKLYVDVKRDENRSADINALNYAQRVIDTYIEMLVSRSFYEEIGSYISPPLPPEKIRSMISFSGVKNTEVFELKVMTKNPETSKAICEKVVELAPQKIRSLKSDASLKVVDRPNLPDQPVSPNIIKNTILGFIAGLILGFLYAVLRDQLDQRIKSDEDITENFNVQILGHIPDLNMKVKSKKSRG